MPSRGGRARRSGAPSRPALTDDAVFTTVGPGLADTQFDPWMFDPDQGFGADAVELSRDLQTVVGIAGTSDERLRTYRTTMDPFGAPDWNHAPFAQGNVPVVRRCSQIDGAKFESTAKPTRAKLRVVRHKRRLVATLTTGTPGRAALTVKRKRRTLAQRTVKISASGRARVRFKVRVRVTVKARFTPTRGTAQTLTARAK